MGKERKYRVVLDTNTLVSAFGWDGNERKVFDFCMEGEIKLCTSNDLLRELKRVLDYPKLNFISAEKKKELIENLIEISDVVEPVEKVNVIANDPEDNKILECALCCEADYIVSGDWHLLELKEYKGIKIVGTKNMLEILRY